MLHSPFSPKILELDCPKEIVNAINSYIDDEDYDPSIFPNLLTRDLDNIFLPKEFCNEIGLTVFIEMCGVEYIRRVNEIVWDEKDSNPPNPIDVNQLLPDDEINGKVYKTCWVNRCHGHHFTPIHTHDGSITGILFLKTLPTDNTMYGVLEFMFGEQNQFYFDRWHPKQIEGKVLVFPSWLRHCVYPTQSSNERRTMSFNLV